LDALGAIRTGEVDCLVLDLIMPEVDGFTVLERVRTDATSAGLPVVVCSSKSLSLDEELLLRRLRAPFLQKEKLSPAQIARALVDARRLATVLAQPLTGSVT
jgi:CheY-like chemotaxis protein